VPSHTSALLPASAQNWSNLVGFRRSRYRLIVCGVRAGLTLTVPLPAGGAKGQYRACATRAAPFTLAALRWSLSVIAS